MKMSYLGELSKLGKRLQKQQEKEDKANSHYGVFVWRGDNMYKESEAIKVYKSDKAADKYADKLNETNPVHVVRRIYCYSGK